MVLRFCKSASFIPVTHKEELELNISFVMFIVVNIEIMNTIKNT